MSKPLKLSLLLALTALSSLSACGTRGPLTLPPGPAPEPLLGNPSTALKPGQGHVSPPIKPARNPSENNSNEPEASPQ